MSFDKGLRWGELLLREERERDYNALKIIICHNIRRASRQRRQRRFTTTVTSSPF